MTKKTEEIYEGNLVIKTDADAKKYKNLTKVTGYLYINSSAKLDAPKLESVGGYLYINSSAKLDAPKLESVGGDLSIYSSAKLDALKSVGGYLYIYSSAKLDAPKLESVGGYLYIKENASLAANKLYPGGFEKFKIIDGIHCVVLSSKQAHNVMVLSCRQPRIKNQKVVGDKFYIAQKGNYNAHGKSIEEAVQELQFKMGDRDTKQYRAMPLKTRKTPGEWAFVYRMCTGACQYGTEQFMKSRKLKKSYTLAEIIDLTKGAYGHEKFKEVVSK